MWEQDLTLSVKVALWQNSARPWLFLQISSQVWVLCNHVCHDLYYGLLQLLLHNEGLCSSPREADSQPTSACCFLLESEKAATDLKQRVLGSAFRLRWDISLVVKVLEKSTFPLLWGNTHLCAGYCWPAVGWFLIPVRKEIGFGLYCFKLNVLACER